MANNALYTVGLLAAVAVGAGGHFAYSSFTGGAGGSSLVPASSSVADTSPVIVTVNGFSITQSMLDMRKNLVKEKVGGMFLQLPMAEQDRVVKENLILEALVDQNMKDSNIANDPEIIKQLAESRQQVLRTAFLDNIASTTLTDEVLRSVYDEQIAKLPDETEARARHILVKDEAKAQDLIAQLKGGAKFEALAAENSLDKGNAEQGGDLGFFSKDQMVPEFATAAFGMEAGQVSQEPVKTSFGYHIIEVLEKRTKPKPSFEEVKDGLAAQERQKVIKDTIDKWRATAVIEDNSAPAVSEPEAPIAAEATTPDQDAATSNEGAASTDTAVVPVVPEAQLTPPSDTPSETAPEAVVPAEVPVATPPIDAAVTPPVTEPVTPVPSDAVAVPAEETPVAQ